MTQPTLGKTEDGREFPQYDGKLLSWDIGSSFTLQDEHEGYPRTRAIIAAFRVYRPEQLECERRQLVKDSFNAIFGRNAARLLALVEEDSHV